jgi:hypothetical protein
VRKQDLVITIGPTGEVSFTVKGVKGAACLAETEFLERALGGAVLAREKTSEYYEEGAGAAQRQGVGDGDGDDDGGER